MNTPLPRPALVTMPVQNTKAVASLVLGVLGFMVPVPFVLGILAIVFGHGALREIRADRGQTGEGLATAGIVLGWIDVALSGLLVIGFLLFIFFFGGLALLAAASS